uniref:Uncharacterized protein n=1 Tax=Tetradesmus obliquus TaxID=3088 RepID=A0A383WIZ5_TETOB
MSSNNSTLIGCNSLMPGSSSASSSMQASSQQCDSLLAHNHLTVNSSLGLVDSYVLLQQAGVKVAELQAMCCCS